MKKIGILLILGLCVISCTKKNSSSSTEGAISVDGSSTVYPITEAVAEEFRKTYPAIRVTVGLSGTGGSFKKFAQAETDINNASRKIKEEEITSTKEKGIDYLEIPVALDGITVVINNENTWVDHLTTEELKQIWKPESSIKTWKQVRATWPDRPIKLYGPGPDSGTFDYFTEVINGKSHAARSDYTKSEDDNVLVMGVSGDKDSLGFFGYAYFKENATKLKAVPIHNGTMAVSPTEQTINDGSYSPLSRTVYIYVSKKSLARPEVKSFVGFYLKNASRLIPQVGYINLPQTQYETALKDL